MHTYYYAANVNNGHLDSIRQVIMMMDFYSNCRTTAKFWRDYFGESDQPATAETANETRQH